MPNRRRSARARRWTVGVLLTGALPAFLYLAITGLDSEDPQGATPTAASSQPAATPSPTAAAVTPQTPSPRPTATAAPTSDRGDALVTLDTIPVKGRAPKTGYDRDQFGPAWADIDGNGCDTRNDILARDLGEMVRDDDACTVLSGLLAGPYSAEWIRFVRGEATSAIVQVDHVVSLSDAWQKGAQQLDPIQRQRFANDPLNLLAVSGPLNQQKGDGDAATWLPANRSFWCPYVARQVAVKARYDLWVTAAERDAMARVLSRCPNEPLPTGSGTTGVVPSGPRPAAGSPSLTTAGTGADTGASASPGSRPDGAYSTCTAARDAGAAPVRRGDPGYGPHLDRDGDGIACE